MAEFQKVAKTGEIPVGEGRSFATGDHVIAVFNVDGEFHAIDDQCPHMGASLSAGHLDGCVVSCPLHAWRFDVKDGTWRDNPRVAINRFDIRVQGDDILVCTQPAPRK